MKLWSLKYLEYDTFPMSPAAGSFWEDRGDRHHCRVDLYAPLGSGVVSI
ncbi:MAG: hypothetical protein U9N13_01845 [Euryarchaeota archaeon]|nr:hypothetical protein [Euryarchaeota archaeon]